MLDTIEKLLKEHTTYSLGKATGINPNQLQRFKTGAQKIENMSLKNAIKLLEYAKKIKNDKSC